MEIGDHGDHGEAAPSPAEMDSLPEHVLVITPPHKMAANPVPAQEPISDIATQAHVQVTCSLCSYR